MNNSKLSSTAGLRLAGKTVVITGGARGFGKEIAGILAAQGAAVVIADTNEEGGKAAAEQISASIGCACGKAPVHFVPCNVTDAKSVAALVDKAYELTGSLDVFISNAGVISAGNLEVMTEEEFDRITMVNYKGFYLCAREAARMMKSIRAQRGPQWFGDIIQINSKSGLRGSKANFAYAGGKFGGIGLVQSFALELAPFNIKVNCVCPGNWYDSPLWSDPEKGLFIQYLNAGKVPGAKTVQDVRDFYVAQTPMKRGCTPADVAKAIMYAIEQTCETGQAIPVTGGQVMLG